MGSALEQNTGAVAYSLKNDLLFHLVMQRDEDALKGLLSAVLNLPLKEIHKVEVMNPIRYGRYADKEIILDILLTLNDNHCINIEMQVYPHKYWVNRSLFYICRMVASQKVGRFYDKLQTTTHIGILDQDLFPEAPQFYSEYQILETRSGQPYTDNFSMRILNLQYMDLARPEDAPLVRWAKLFKATTWEEIRQLACQDSSIRKAAEAMSAILTDEENQVWLEAHEKYLRDQAAIQEEIRLGKAELSEMKEELSQTKEELSQTKGELSQAKGELSQTKGELSQTKGELSQVEGELSQAKGELSQAYTRIEELQKELARYR